MNISLFPICRKWIFEKAIHYGSGINDVKFSGERGSYVQDGDIFDE